MLSCVTAFPELGFESLEGLGCPGPLASATGGVDIGIGLGPRLADSLRDVSDEFSFEQGVPGQIV